jgi:hypothetical protein
LNTIPPLLVNALVVYLTTPFKITKIKLIIKYINLGIVTNIKIKTMKIFNKENGISFLVTLTAVMVGLAVHQLYVAPRISKKG